MSGKRSYGGRRYAPGTARPTIAPVPIIIADYTKVKLKTNKELPQHFVTSASKASDVGQNGSTTPLVATQSDYDFVEARNLPHPTTDCETLIHLLKGSLGSGILAMPLAFKNAGLMFGVFATLFVGFFCTYCVHVLVNCAQILYNRARVPALDYSEVAETAFKLGPEPVKKYRRLAKAMVDWFLVLDLYGCCCVYIVFVATNLKQVMDYYIESSYDLRLYMLCLLPVLILMNLIRNLKWLAPLSLFANIIMGVGMAITLYYCFNDVPPVEERDYIADVHQFPLFFGVVIFALEGVGVVMPLENDMKTPTHFIGCPSVLSIGMSVVILLYSCVGFMGYLKYGDDTKGSITLNLPTEEGLAQSVKIMIAVCILCTYALQFYVPMGIIWKNVKDRFRNHENVAEYAIRMSLVVLSVGIAAAVPNLGPLISLIGALCLSTLGLIFPSIIELVVLWDGPGFGKCDWKKYKNYLVIIFGILGGSTGVFVSIQEIIASYGAPETVHS